MARQVKYGYCSQMVLSAIHPHGVRHTPRYPESSEVKTRGGGCHCRPADVLGSANPFILYSCICLICVYKEGRVGLICCYTPLYSVAVHTLSSYACPIVIRASSYGGLGR